LKTKLLGYNISDINALFLYFISFSYFKKNNFIYSGTQINYFNHKYNLILLNEKIIKILVIKFVLNLVKGKVLEVGDVFSNFGLRGDDVVDKYERYLKNLLNFDFRNSSSKHKYDFINSIPNIQLIGQKEEEHPQSLIRTILHLKIIFWKMFISFPIRYTQELDESTVKNIKFNSPYSLGNAVAFCKYYTK